MIISGHKREDQPLLFDLPIAIGEHGYARHVVGELIEEITALVLGGKRHRTSSNCDYCPDVSINSKRFFECKASGLSNQFFIYAGRLTKDIEFASRQSLSYVIWSHNAAVKDARSVVELRSLLLQRIRCGYIVPFNVIADICASITPMKLNSAYGHREGNGKMYGSGYRIPLRLIEDFKSIEYRYGHGLPTSFD